MEKDKRRKVSFVSLLNQHAENRKDCEAFEFFKLKDNYISCEITFAVFAAVKKIHYRIML